MVFEKFTNFPNCTRNHVITYPNTLKNCSYSEFPTCSWLCFYMFFFFFNVDYSVYVIKIALFRISLLLSHIWTRKLKSVSCLWVWMKCFSKKKMYAARGLQFSPSKPGDRNRKFVSKSGHRPQLARNFVRFIWRSVDEEFLFVNKINFCKGFSKMKQLKMSEYKVDLHSA